MLCVHECALAPCAAAAAESRLLLVCTLGGSRDDRNGCLPAVCVEDMDSVLDSWDKPSPALATVGI